MKVLIVEDDANLRETLSDNLREDGYEVFAAAEGDDAQVIWSVHIIDVIVLDIMLPGRNGYDLCRQLRSQNVEARVLMLTARTLEEDILLGFQSGADDYLTKPYRLRELLARVRALSRRSAAPSRELLRFDDFELDPAARTFKRTGQGEVDLTRTEFDVLHCLLRSRDRALSREELLRSAWGPGVHVDERTVDNFISALKKKLSWSAQSRWRIRTVRGYGYRMEVDAP